MRRRISFPEFRFFFALCQPVLWLTDMVWILRTPQATLSGAVKPLDVLLHLHFPIAAGIALLLAGCAQQAVKSEAMPQPSPTVGTNDTSGWYLIAPPQRAYASDRSPMMGGPLATSGISENRGAYSVYSLTQPDTSAPLSHWERVAGIFSSEKECGDYKSSQLKEANDPAWIAKVASKKRDRLVYPAAQRDFIGSERCATSQQISSH
jgi:hypothetical protein